ncbi:MAG: Asp-tRNA(Asn)/Glu-tRNA(Gln) amidotransferase subunit GatB [Mycoplasmoidaceae bacterium]|nr:Asp-tRNA(Asn)/Glu-tRNA(Gln) amidotransferase subunit GatB [Mycoplasmoidaceae bacterium]
MNNFIPTIGIEVHIALNTKSKMFSPSKNLHNDPVNTNINEIDLALPGTLPSVNEGAVIKAIQLAKALNMQIDQTIRFDRKNYFYQDLPKGFQITQQFFPIGKNGVISISNKDIRIERIHMEEDTAKQILSGTNICLDYNRAGVPLIEVVSRPDIHSSKEAYEYLVNLKRLVSFIDISDAKMEDGSLRADINISVAPVGANKLGTKVEVKNVNSFNNVIKAIDYEINRQTQLILNNESIQQETRRWDDVSKTTIFMRGKSNLVEYCYFTEPNILAINLTNEFVKDAIDSMKPTANEVQKHLESLNINNILIGQLLDDYQLYKIFDYVSNQTKDPNQAIT